MKPCVTKNVKRMFLKSEIRGHCRVERTRKMCVHLKHTHTLTHTVQLRSLLASKNNFSTDCTQVFTRQKEKAAFHRGQLEFSQSIKISQQTADNNWYIPNLGIFDVLKPQKEKKIHVVQQVELRGSAFVF